METFSLFYWLILLVIAALNIVPAARILKRVGHSPWLSVLYVLPLVNLVFVWIFAFTRWPKEPGSPA